VPQTAAPTRIRLGAVADATGRRNVPYFVDNGGHTQMADDVLGVGGPGITSHPEYDSTGAIGDVLRRWSAVDENSRNRITLVSGQERGSLKWRKPIDEHAKILMIGGHRAANSPAVAASSPPALVKFPTAFAQPGDVLPLPSSNKGFEIDVAVGFVIGHGGTRIPPSQAADAVAGYVLLADVTDADAYQEEARTNNGLIAKNHRALSPISPFITLRAGTPIPSFKIWLKVNGVERQAVATSDLRWTVNDAIAAWSLSTLVPGDIVALGAAASRSGIPPVSISDGDEVEIGCDLLGVARHTVAAAALALQGP
jgi:2-keto-4-pentenoate hydratase/2-oxohepta-3-ene-1,7-dioic acid hydratase in catechol pathway